jgi:hypothetical protein
MFKIHRKNVGQEKNLCARETCIELNLFSNIVMCTQSLVFMFKEFMFTDLIFTELSFHGHRA